MSALLFAGKLILVVDGGRPRLDHPLHQLEGVQGSAESRFRVGHDGEIVVGVIASLAVLDLIRPAERVVDPSHDVRNAVGRIQALIGIHLAGVVGVGSHLPAAEIDGLEPRLGHLHGLVAGQRPQGIDVGLGLQQPPEFLGAATGQRVLDVQTAPQPLDIEGSVVAANAVPTRIERPTLFHFSGGRRCGHGDLLVRVRTR